MQMLAAPAINNPVAIIIYGGFLSLIPPFTSLPIANTVENTLPSTPICTVFITFMSISFEPDIDRLSRATYMDVYARYVTTKITLLMFLFIFFIVKDDDFLIRIMHLLICCNQLNNYIFYIFINFRCAQVVQKIRNVVIF